MIHPIIVMSVVASGVVGIRDYTVSIYKDKENDGLKVEVVGHLFDAE